GRFTSGLTQSSQRAWASRSFHASAPRSTPTTTAVMASERASRPSRAFRVAAPARVHASAKPGANAGRIAVVNLAGGAGRPAHHIQYDVATARYDAMIASDAP